MARHSKTFRARLPDLNSTLLVVMLVIVWIAGGASRADVFGQTVVRVAAWLIVIIALLFIPRPQLKPVAPVVLVLLALVGLLILQLIPLPPSIWTTLPGREILTQSAIVSGQPQPWRPISLSPDASMNALSSLVVPAVILALAAGLRHEGQTRLLALLLGLILGATLVGLLQFSGSRFDNPLINDTAGDVSATFANRNHFALLLACGCVIAPAWAFHSRRNAQWKGVAAAGMVAIFALMILATGSRMGLLLGFVGISLGVLSVWGRFLKRLQRLPRRIWMPLGVTVVGLFLLFIFMSIILDRAVSVNRAISLDAGKDLRTAALPSVWEMIRSYWPVGSGVGAFDPVYRIHEPDLLLSISYLNHAHNDWVEFLLDGGMPAFIILLFAVAWWVWASVRVWRLPIEASQVLPRTGSAILLLVAFASVVDYPARTPIVMTLVIISAVWLSSGESTRARVAG